MDPKKINSKHAQGSDKDGKRRILEPAFRPPARDAFTTKEQSEFLWRELQERMSAVPKRGGLLFRLFKWLSSVFSALAEALDRKPAKIPANFFSSSSDFLETCWQMICDTDFKNLVVNDGETRAEAVRRVMSGHLAMLAKKHRQENADVFASYRYDPLLDDPAMFDEWRSEGLLDRAEPAKPGDCCGQAGCAKGRKVFGPDDPMLDAVRRERLKKLLAKDSLSDPERNELQELLSMVNDVLVLEENEGDRP